VNGHAVITGGGTGIGLAIAKRLAQKGYEVWLVDKDASQGAIAERKLRESGHRATHLSFDITEWNSVNEVFDLFSLTPDDDHVLVNNAAARSSEGLLEQTEEAWSELVSVMMTGTFRFSQEFIRRVKESKSRGSICNIGSIVSHFASDQSPAYHAAKAGVSGLTSYLAVAAGKAGAQVRVNAVEPGLIIQERHLEIYNGEGNAVWRAICEKYQPLGIIGTENDVANAVAWLSSDNAGYINGATIRIDGGATVQEQFTLARSFHSKELD